MSPSAIRCGSSVITVETRIAIRIALVYNDGKPIEERQYMAPIQMNVRIDRNLKAAGDRAFDSIGYTPTQVIRAVWEFAARNAADREALLGMARLLQDPRESARAENEAAAQDAEFERWLACGPDIVRDYAHETGITIDSAAALSPEDYDKLLEDALDEDFRSLPDRM